MERFHSLLLSIWREVCRHLELPESTHTIAHQLASRMPLQRIILWHIPDDRRALTCVADGQLGDQPTLLGRHRVLDTANGLRLLQWARKGRSLALRLDDRQARDFQVLLPDPPSVSPGGKQQDILIGPLGEPPIFNGVVIMTALPGRGFRDEHMQVFSALIEPFTVALQNHERLQEINLLREVAEADKHTLLRRMGREKLQESEVVGAEEGLAPVMERVRQVSPLDLPVLILGETGTGKEVIARAIHQGSPRRDKPFIRINCGAIPPELIDSELFGHEKGSFTSAVALRRGWFERAHQGSLFLDEIGELPLQAQVRLLRVLQDGMFERVGGEQPIHVDVRIIAATHRDLATMVREGRFREDLWYRIAVFPILLPPLRERLGDIGKLARHFAHRAALRFGVHELMPEDEDVALLQQYHWPGNVRELASVIDRAVILGNGNQLHVAAALGVTPPLITPPRSAPAITTPAPAAFAALSPGRPPQHVPDFEYAMRQHLESVLRLTQGRVDGPFGAARKLNLNPNTLRSKLRKLGIKPADFKNHARSDPNP